MRATLAALGVLVFTLAPFGARSAHAAADFDSAYLFESVYLTDLVVGDTGAFAVFFTNTGALTWVAGTSTQVNLAACRDDKITCNVSPEEFAWNPGTWLSTTAYATQAKSSVAPNEFTSFTYEIKVPINTRPATYHFNGDLVVAATSALIHPQGYFQDAVVVTGAPRAPADLQANVGDYNGVGGANDVRVSFTVPAGNAENGYDVLRADGTCSLLPDNPSFQLLRTLTLRGGQAGTYLDFDRPNGTYCYEVRVPDATRNTFVYSNQAAATVTGSIVGVLPFSASAVLKETGQATDRLTTGARFDITFSVPMRLSSAAIRFADADCGAPASQSGPEATCSGGQTQTTGEIVCGTAGNASCFLSLDGRTLTVTLTAPPTEIAPGSVSGLQYPLTVIASRGITDANGVGWDLVASTDRVIGPLGQ